jgi:hypothetical protein
MVSLYFDSQFRVPLANLEQRPGWKMMAEYGMNRVDVNTLSLECGDEFFGQSEIVLNWRAQSQMQFRSRVRFTLEEIQIGNSIRPSLDTFENAIKLEFKLVY